MSLRLAVTYSIRVRNPALMWFALNFKREEARVSGCVCLSEEKGGMRGPVNEGEKEGFSGKFPHEKIV